MKVGGRRMSVGRGAGGISEEEADMHKQLALQAYVAAGILKAILRRYARIHMPVACNDM